MEDFEEDEDMENFQEPTSASAAIAESESEGLQGEQASAGQRFSELEENKEPEIKVHMHSCVLCVCCSDPVNLRVRVHVGMNIGAGRLHASTPCRAVYCLLYFRITHICVRVLDMNIQIA